MYVALSNSREAERISKNGIDRRRIAVKIIDRRKAPDDFVNKFLPRELDIYLKISHPNIIKIYEIMQISHRVYIFMEIAEGGDLLDYLKVNFYKICKVQWL
jgi:serine kinase